MIISQLILNPSSRQVQRELANPYELHRTLMKAFPIEMPPGQRVLYRLEMRHQPPHLTLLVQSTLPPDWSALTKNGYLLEEPQTKEFKLSFQRGQRLIFRLLANPTKRLRSKDPNKDGKRVALYRMEEQEQWLRRKSEQNGFRVLSLLTTSLDNQAAYKRIRATTNLADNGEKLIWRMTHFAVRFDGVLEVQDEALFYLAIERGIGSAKGFGFGLLSVAPMHAENG